MSRLLGTLSVVALTIILGSALQIAFWKTTTRTIAEALLHNYELWFVYLVVSGILMERFFGFLNTRMKKPREKK